MERNSVYAKLLLVLGLVTAVLTACTITNNPTPQAPLAEVVTVSVERPSVTTTPQPSNTPTATKSLIETAGLMQPRQCQPKFQRRHHPQVFYDPF